MASLPAPDGKLPEIRVSSQICYFAGMRKLSPPIQPGHVKYPADKYRQLFYTLPFFSPFSSCTRQPGKPVFLKQRWRVKPACCRGLPAVDAALFRKF
ncbi:hypothetical protein P0E69_22655 (plasmid) [Chimaeribacter arupi]|uniref:hypothetical protein n=1 Tax=Chimaeribacter arupi TaxID=2060066 RepID=UPI0027120238|nr:hypothetical protein [Chimaeribacter arupi]WKZ94768.1 hypothetical protein P0E69_22655 [Chimaeribacter arupi]